MTHVKKPPTPLRTRSTLAAICALGLGLAACAPGSSGNDGDDSAAAEDPGTGGETTDGEEVVLRVVDARAGEPQLQATYDRIDREFEDRNPGVTVERESINLEELLATINLRLSGDDVPDVTAVNQGHATMGRLVSGGLLRSLEDVADEHGWEQSQSELLLAMNGRFTEDGPTMAEGELWAVSDTGAPVGLFYNAAHLDELGLEAPETWEDVEDAMDAAQDADMTPVMFGNVDAWPGIHLYQLFLNDQLGQPAASDFVYGASPLEEAPAVAASEHAQDWVEAGYLADGWEGIDYDSTWQRFADGDGLFMVTGSWVAADLAERNEDIRFALMPPSDGGPFRATAGGDFPFAIPTEAAHPDLAADYIAFRVSEDAAAMYVEDGHIPTALPDGWEELVEDGTLEHDMLSAWAQLEEDDGMVPYIDWATPDFYEVATSEIQNLLGGQTDPEAFVEAWNAEWASFHDES